MSDTAEDNGWAILPRIYSKVGGKHAERARRQRETPSYKVWRAKYESTDEFKAKVREREAKRNGDPVWQERRREYARRTRERRRIYYLVRSAIQRSKKNGLACDEAYLREVIAVQRPSECPCCSVKLDYRMKRDETGRGEIGPKDNAPSLDRIDCLEGYVAGNVVIICWRCNAIKRDATLNELERITAYMRSQLCGQ
jgi:hypothetical protein